MINVENNSTAPLAGPASKDPNASYAASITALVQLDSTGAVSFLPYKQGDTAANQAAKWTPVAAISAVVPPGSTATTGNGTSSPPTGPPGSGTGANNTAAKTGASGGTSTSPSQTAAGASHTGGALAVSDGHQTLALLATGVMVLASLLF